jgi:hypothetical protein
VLNPTAPVELVATNRHFFDPAIDTSDPEQDDNGDPLGPSFAERLTEYRKTRDLSKLPMRPSAEPTLFVCKPVPHRFERNVLRGLGAGTRFEYAFAAACHLIKLPGGKELRPDAKLIQWAHGAKGLDDDALDRWIRTVVKLFGGETVDEVGEFVCERAAMPEGAEIPFRCSASRGG